MARVIQLTLDDVVQTLSNGRTYIYGRNTNQECREYGHRWQQLNEYQLFCTRCNTIRTDMI